MIRQRTFSSPAAIDSSAEVYWEAVNDAAEQDLGLGLGATGGLFLRGDNPLDSNVLVLV